MEENINSIDIAVIHPNPGIYIYQLDIDDRYLYGSTGQSSPKYENTSCIKKVTRPRNMFESLRTSFFGSRSEETEDEIYREVVYIGNDLVAVITTKGVA